MTRFLPPLAILSLAMSSLGASALAPVSPGGVALFLVSLLFAGVGVADGGRSVLVFIVLTLLGVVYYQARRRTLARRGVQIADLLAGPRHQ